MPEEIPGLTNSELKSIQLVTKVSSSFSFIGSLFIFITFLRFPVLRNINSRLIFFMSVADLFAAASQFMGRWPIETGNEGFCVLQAVLQQQFILSSDLWALFVATNLLCLIVLGRSEDQIRSYERFYHPIAWGLPMVTWILLLIAFPEGHRFGDATLWCWIASEYPGLQLLFYYLFNTLIFLYNLSVYITVGVKIITVMRQTRSVKSDELVRQQDKRKLKYMRQVGFYVIMFVITDIPGSVNRLQNNFERGRPVFTLFILHALFGPLQGFFNAIIYSFTNMWNKFKVMKQQSAKSKSGNEYHLLERN
jgi:hypothetical protein